MDYTLFFADDLNNKYNEMVTTVCNTDIYEFAEIDEYYFDLENQAVIQGELIRYTKLPYSSEYLIPSLSINASDENLDNYLQMVKKNKIQSIGVFVELCKEIHRKNRDPSSEERALQQMRKDFFNLFFQIKVIKILSELVNKHVNMRNERLGLSREQIIAERYLVSFLNRIYLQELNSVEELEEKS